MDIAAKYADLLKVPSRAIARLTTQYPSHGFVIDYEEALDFLPDGFVRRPSEVEAYLEKSIAEKSSDILYYPVKDPGIVQCLNPRTQTKMDNEDEEHHGDSKTTGTVSEEAPTADMDVRSAAEQPDATEAVRCDPR